MSWGGSGGGLDKGGGREALDGEALLVLGWGEGDLAVVVATVEANKRPLPSELERWKSWRVRSGFVSRAGLS